VITARTRGPFTETLFILLRVRYLRLDRWCLPRSACGSCDAAVRGHDRWRRSRYRQDPHQLSAGAALQRHDEFDDVVEALKVMTSPEQQPVLHYWDTHPQAMSWSAEEIVALTGRVCDVLAPAAEAVVANHIENAHPVVLEATI
jgi:hypothetical protein